MLVIKIRDGDERKVPATVAPVISSGVGRCVGEIDVACVLDYFVGQVGGCFPIFCGVMRTDGGLRLW